MSNKDIVDDFFNRDGEILFTKELEMKGSKSNATEMLNYKNPLYTTFDPEWSFYLDSYEGGTNFISSGNIFRHARETNEDFSDRVRSAVYMNYVQPLVNFFSNFIFSEEISRDGGTHNEQYQKFLFNVNGKGDSMDLFMRDICDLNQIFGHVDILLDKNRNKEGAVLSLLQEQELGLDSPYAIVMYPHEVFDWRFSPVGKFTYLKRCVVDGDYKYFTIWYPQTVFEIVTKIGSSKDTIENKEIIPNPLGEIPVVRSYYRRSKKYKDMGISFLTDISYINRNIMNLTSLIGEFLRKQCFNVLAKEMDNAIAFKDQVEGNMGTSNVMEVPRGAQFPQYVSPPVDPAQFLQSEREKNVLEIYRIAAQDTAVEIFTGQSKSGDAQNQSFHKTIPYISSRAENLEKTELEIARLWLKWTDPSAVWNGSIKYKDDYSLQNLTSLLIQAKMLFSDIKIPSTTFIKNEMLRLVGQFDGKVNSEDMNKIKQEIDENVTDDYIQSLFNSKVGANNLRGVSGTIANSQQMKQGVVQEALGNNEAISGIGADNVT